jgi:cobalt-zinc-cadmium resistance protein CzcA
MDGIIVISYYNHLLYDGMEASAAVVRACEVQMRPVAMTCIAACVGLLPAAVSTGIGSQVQKPLALVVVGGILVAPFLILVVLPVLISRFAHRQYPRVAQEPPEAPGDPGGPGSQAPDDSGGSGPRAAAGDPGPARR